MFQYPFDLSALTKNQSEVIDKKIYSEYGRASWEKIRWKGENTKKAAATHAILRSNNLVQKLNRIGMEMTPVSTEKRRIPQSVGKIFPQ